MIFLVVVVILVVVVVFVLLLLLFLGCHRFRHLYWFQTSPCVVFVVIIVMF